MSEALWVVIAIQLVVTAYLVVVLRDQTLKTEGLIRGFSNFQQMVVADLAMLSARIGDAAGGGHPDEDDYPFDLPEDSETDH